MAVSAGVAELATGAPGATEPRAAAAAAREAATTAGTGPVPKSCSGVGGGPMRWTLLAEGGSGGGAAAGGSGFVAGAVCWLLAGPGGCRVARR